jgi:hypothetical protein
VPAPIWTTWSPGSIRARAISPAWSEGWPLLIRRSGTMPTGSSFIEIDRIGIRGRHIEAEPAQDRPGAGANEVLAAYRGKGVLYPDIRNQRGGGICLA